MINSRKFAQSSAPGPKRVLPGMVVKPGPPGLGPFDSVRPLQARLGNQAMGRLLQSGILMRKIGIGHAADSMAPSVQRELRRRPPGREQEPPALSPEQIQDAIVYNNGRYSETHTRIIQDIVGTPQTGRFDENTIHAIVEWQADFRMTDMDGMVGMRTLRTIVLEMMRGGYSRGRIVWMIVDGHNMPTTGLASLTYDPALAGSNASTSGPIPGDSTVVIGPDAFAQGYEGLVHTIRHELEHVQQRRSGMANQNLREFLAEGIEIMSVGMHWEGLAGFMDDAGRCLQFWDRLSTAEQQANWGRFTEIRTRVQQRFDRARAADQTTHQAVIDDFNARNRP